MNEPLVPIERKIKKTKIIDVLIVGTLSIALSILTFCSATAQFYDLERGNAYASVIGQLLHFPLFVISILLYWLGGSSEGAVLGSGILLQLASPVLAFVFWFVIFWFLAKLIKKLSKKDSWKKHFLSLLVVIVLIAPYLHYETGSNKVDDCLSGALNYQIERGYSSSEPSVQPSYFTVGPDFCFDTIIEPLIYEEPLSSEGAINFCLELSSIKIVHGTQTTYRDYCMYALGGELLPNKSSTPDFTTDFHLKYMSDVQLPTYQELMNHGKNNAWRAIYQSRLCGVYGSLTNSTENKNNCLVYFLNRPKSPDYQMSKIYCKDIDLPISPQRCIENPN